MRKFPPAITEHHSPCVRIDRAKNLTGPPRTRTEALMPGPIFPSPKADLP